MPVVQQPLPPPASPFYYHGIVVTHTPLPWVEAQVACEQQGGTLAKIDTRERSMDLHALLTTDTWIGANDREVEGEWRWNDGSILGRISGGTAHWNGYANWDTNEPNNDYHYQHFQDCVEVRTTGKWDDNDCNATLPFACQVNNLPRLWLTDSLPLLVGLAVCGILIVLINCACLFVFAVPKWTRHRYSQQSKLLDSSVHREEVCSTQDSVDDATRTEEGGSLQYVRQGGRLSEELRAAEKEQIELQRPPLHHDDGDVEMHYLPSEMDKEGFDPSDSENKLVAHQKSNFLSLTTPSMVSLASYHSV
mmetsp:Transcript_17018/g.28428  ORF Transcript_17018/g.28428 Transcript_17018/m.28428 type:complete len:306 (+) Transcript_17018:28-945(+)